MESYPMSDPQSIPQQATSHPLVQAFVQDTQLRMDLIAQAQGKTAPQISIRDIQVDQGLPGDGTFEFLYKNEALDALIRGRVSLDSQDMAYLNQMLSDKTQAGLFHYREAPEACSLSRSLFGETEEGGQACQDGWINPKLQEGLNQFESLQVYDQYCQGAYQKFLANSPKVRGIGDYSINRVQVENYVPGDSEFILSYRNLTNHFYCRGDVAAHGKQEMVLSHGVYDPLTKGLKQATDPTLHPMVDVCQLTEALTGTEELYGECHENTPIQREVRQGAELAWTGFEYTMAATGAYELSGLGVKGLDKIFKRGWHDKTFAKWPKPGAWMWRQFKRPFQATGRGLKAIPGQATRFARWARPGFGNAWNSLRSLPGRGLQTFRSLRSVGPGLRTIASRLPSLSRFLPFGATGVGAGSMGLSQMGAGGTALRTVGSFGLAGVKVVGAFAVGAGVGIGLAKAQEYVLPEGYTTTDLFAKGFHAAWGEPTQEFMDWGDKYLSWLP